MSKTKKDPRPKYPAKLVPPGKEVMSFNAYSIL